MLDTKWKTDNYKFVGKAFDFAYANRMNKLAPIIGEEVINSIDYELTGGGDYGEMVPYVGRDLNDGEIKRGFKTIITPAEYNLRGTVDYKAHKIDKFGETRKCGTRLGNSASMTVYMHVLRMFGNAWTTSATGGDGVCWANAAHPVASLGSNGRVFTPDPDSGTYSNTGTDAFTVAAITAAQTKANKFVTPAGLPFLCEMDTVLISPDLEDKAKRFFGADARLLPETGDNDANPVYGMQYIVVGGGDAGFTGGKWAVCDRRLMKELVKLVYNTKPTVMNTELENPLVDAYVAYADFGVGWGDGRMIYFNNPD